MFSQAHATTLTVTSTADAGGTCPGASCTLRQAIATAVSGDTINFAAGITTVTLTSAELLINKNLTISGPGANLLSVQRSAAAGNFRIFNISGNFNVTISGLTIANGNSPGDFGGGIYNNGMLNLTNSTISGNMAAVSGGIYNAGGTVTIANSTISGNTAEFSGGGIYNAGGMLTITNSTISGNSANNGVGGGILNGGTLTITNSTISGNSANNDNPGGGIYNYDTGTITITNSTISGNSAGIGAGIYNTGMLTVTNATISGNTALFGGGGIFNSPPPQPMIVTGKNTAGVRGGTIPSATIPTTNITNSTISGNTAPNTSALGGGIGNSYGTVTMTNSTVSSNSAGGGGGGISNYGTGTLTITNSTISGNSVTSNFGFGGGIFSHANGTVNARSTIIALNSAFTGPDVQNSLTSQGYNLIGSTSGGTITGTTTGNQLNVNPMLDPNGLQPNGGPTQTIALVSGSTAIDKGHSSGLSADQRGFTRPVDSNSIVNPGDGSDIGAFEVQADQLPGCVTIVQNKNDSGPDSLRAVIINVCAGSTITFAPNVTGAIDLTSGELPINRALTINGPGARNLTVNGSGTGRIFTVASGAGTVKMSGLTLTNGHPPGTSFPGGFGGAILNAASLTLTDCTISGSVANVHGGAIYNNGASGNAILALTNCTLSGNSASLSGGAIFSSAYLGLTTMTLTNCTLSQNSASQYGGAIYNDGTGNGNAALTLTNCTLNQNMANLIASGIYNDALNPSTSGVATLLLRNTILRSGDARENLVNDGGTITSGGSNLSSDAANGAPPPSTAPGGFLNAAGDIRNTDPNLAPLANNGGPTDTNALVSPSAAINAGRDRFAPPSDQRGYLRNGISDIGAFELGGGQLRITSITRLMNGHVVLQGVGVPNAVHTLHWSPDLSPNSFNPLTPFTADANGALTHDDAGTVGLTKRFYRLSFP